MAGEKEIIDVVDENDNIIGRASRVACHIDNSLIHRGVMLLLFDSTNRVFLTQRGENKSEFPGALDASVAGHVRSGESYEQRAERELQEELGVSGVELKKVGKFNCFTASERAIEGVFACKFDGELVLGEAASGKFYTLKEAGDAIAFGNATPWLEGGWKLFKQFWLKEQAREAREREKQRAKRVAAQKDLTKNVVT
ncbi:NUDIX domain-containing protein [Candidatus Micrarchaeota archaeon]|nr:NUDIX domain-containing protein [Candidatus Micrarchaeota archaeon]